MDSKQSVMVVLGTRPEVIKLAPVIAALRGDSSAFSTRVVFTSQHREMAASIAAAFALVPDNDLGIMTPGQTPPEVMARVIAALDPVLAAAAPGLVVVQGDTTTALAAALAAYYRQIPVAHVEAGLRTESLYNPFPEEMNRRLISRLASLHFAATDANRETLLAENVPAGSIHVTGNPVIDALRMIVESDAPPPPLVQAVRERGNRLLLLTTHRRENFGAPQHEIFRAIGSIVDAFADVEVVFPVHPNPAVTESVASWLPAHDRVHAVAPMEYPEFVRLLAASHLVLTDSGGLQEEAPALGRPVLILRTTTEREEIVRCGGARLVGIDHDAIVAEASRLLADTEAYDAMAVPRFPFGSPGASERIAGHVRDWMRRSGRPA